MHETEEDEVDQDNSISDANDDGLQIDDDAGNLKKELCDNGDGDTSDSGFSVGDDDFVEGDSSTSTDSELGDDIELENEVC